MSQPSMQLPAEVWTHVFGFLLVADRLNVRASCKYFQKLIDNRTLWKDYILELTFPNGTYNKLFWSTVRRWKVSSAVVRSFQPKQWNEVATELPDLTTISVINVCWGAFDCLKHFTNLTRLYFQGCTTPFPLDTLRTVSPRLTHLSFCGTQFSETSFDVFVFTASQFTSLKSLVFHKVESREYPVQIIYRIVSALPHLTHLSLSVTYYSSRPRMRLEPLRNASLSSLEIVNYEADLLPENLMKLLPSLRSLAVFFESHPEEECHLATWISDLPHLSTLVVAKGPTLGEYAHTIPSTVTNVTLSPAVLFNDRCSELLLLREQVPNLRHFHLDLSTIQRKEKTQYIPYTFHKLQTLKVRHEHVPEKDFLGLARLKELRCLELLDSVSPPSALTQKLQRLSGNRIKICKRQSDVMRCPCVSAVY